MHAPSRHPVAAALSSGFARRAAIETSAWSLLQAVLPQLGTVLLCSRTECGSGSNADATLAAARWLRAAVIVERDGPRELLCLGSEAGCTTHLLCLLPDSDFLAWEQLLAALPRQALMAVPEATCCRSVERPTFRWVQWLRGALPDAETRWHVRSGSFHRPVRGADTRRLDFHECRSLSPSSRRLASLMGDEVANLQQRIDHLAATTGGSTSTH
jgi:hypothetical protein